jgi:hypothetical protein
MKQAETPFHEWRCEDAHRTRYPLCPVILTPHNHLDEATASFRPSPNSSLELSRELQLLAELICKSYDGLLPDDQL